MLPNGPLMRIDNLFLNTRSVSSLISAYSNVLGIPVRREQMITESLTWAEIGYGGMELSFRLHDATSTIHPENKATFLEFSPGAGATISFEVSDMERAREALLERGVEFLGPTIPCTDGQELISLFKDHRGRPVQLYQPAFRTGNIEFFGAGGVSGRGSGALLANKEFMDARQARPGSNLLDVRGLGLCAAYDEVEPEDAIKFYGDMLQIPVSQIGTDVEFELDSSRIRFRKWNGEDKRDEPKLGATVAFEVVNVERAVARARLFKNFTRDESRSEHFIDPEGNSLEFWPPQ